MSTPYTTQHELETAWDQLLDETYPCFYLGSSVFMPSQILKTLDPIMYNEGLLDFEDGLMKMEDEQMNNFFVSGNALFWFSFISLFAASYLFVKGE